MLIKENPIKLQNVSKRFNSLSWFYYVALGITLTAGLLLWISISSVIAQTNGGQGLSISPPLISLEADPGETVELDITLRNITGRDMVVRGEVNDFVARDESGEPMILLDDDVESSYSLKRYISSIPELPIAADEQVVATVSVVIPENASPGAHMGVIRFSGVSSGSDTDGSQVALSASVGTLVLINVSGDVDSSLSIEELAVMAVDGDSDLSTKVRSTDSSMNSGFLDSGPLTVALRLSNTGNIYLQPQGSITITNIFGREVNLNSSDEDNDSEDKSIVFNSDKRNVLPESIRRIEQPLDKSFWFGRYTLTADIEYGPDRETVSQSLSFWVIPYKNIAIALVIIATLTILGVKGLKMYNRHIVTKFQQGNQQKVKTDKKK